jgi:hypothetical protein
MRFADYGTSLGFSRSSDMVEYDSQNQGVVPNYAPFYVTFVIAVVTVVTVMLTVLTVKMIFAIDTVMKTTAAANRRRRVRICWEREVINYWRWMK